MIKFLRLSKVQKPKKPLKLNACFFCGSLEARPARHLEQSHKDEPEVSCLKNATKEERKKAFGELIAKGNWAHNEKVFVRGDTANLVLKKQVSAKEHVTKDELLPCLHCKQIYRKPHLYKHFNECPKNINAAQNRGLAKIGGISVLPKTFKIKQSAEKNILNRLREGEIKELIKGDPLLLRFVDVAIENALTQSSWKHTRARVRALAQFLQCAREASENPELNLTDTMQNVKEHLSPTIAKFSKNFQIFNNLEQLRSDLLLLYEDLIVDSNFQEAVWDRAKRAFVHIWKREIRGKLNFNRNEVERYRDVQLPSTKEVQDLYSYICAKMDALMDTDIWNYIQYRDLCKFTVAKVTLHNYRRGNEVARMTRSNYQRRSSYDPKKFLDCEMGNFEKTMGKVTEVVKLKGKSASHPTVTAILTPPCIRAIDKILEVRDRYIPAANEHVFARRGGVLMHFEGPDLLREVTEEAGVQKSYLTFTGLRKFCATKFCWMDIPEETRTLVYQHMGHTANIHKAVYQMNADLAKNTIVPAILFKMINNVEVPENVTAKEAEEIIFQKMVGFEEMSEELNSPSNESNVPLLSDDQMTPISIPLVCNSPIPSSTSIPNFPIAFSSTSVISVPNSPIASSSTSVISVPNSTIASAINIPMPTTPTLTCSSHKLITPSSNFSLRLSPNTPTSLIPSKVLQMLGTTPPPTKPPSIKRKLFTSSTRTEESLDFDKDSTSSDEEYNPSAKTKRITRPNCQLKKLMAEKERKWKRQQVSNADNTDKKSSNYKFMEEKTMKNSKKSWPPRIKDIVAKEFFEQLTEKTAVETWKLEAVRVKIKQEFPYFQTNLATLRAFVCCNFPKTKSFGKHMEDAASILGKSYEGVAPSK